MPTLLQSISYLALVLASFSPLSVWGFDNTRNDNVAVYWGQNSFGATNPSDTANWQKTLSFYCQDNSIDAFPLAFLDVAFGTGGLPSINLANICNDSDDPVFPGTDLPNCSFLASDIQTCQAKGKIVTISIGGATGAVSFTSDSQAQQFADTIWNLFLGGSSSTRPFGSAVLDGVDLDLEGGSPSHWPAFVTQIRSHASGASKKYYITGAPQCPFPDAFLGSVLNSVGFDAIYVQFYNNFCGLQAFTNPNAWNFAQWDNWAKTVSPNRNVKIYIGAPAAPQAAGSGYVSASTLASDALQTRSQFSSFGGVMLWDASQAHANGNFAAAIKSALSNGGAPVPTTSVPPTSTTHVPPTSTTSSPSPSPSSGSCGTVSAWVSTIAYVGGDQAVFGYASSRLHCAKLTTPLSGHLWTAKWWNFDETPGGASGAWQDNGLCGSSLVGKTNHRTTSETPKLKQRSRIYGRE
ncbi:glycoside hydrolase [Lactarius akahatsu]|uniref:chitinase n=1 Tax=Lactarius akahatsu TaxID=416441 RepID=A0AAD4L5B5_9AGAM|nr:glycoside hydrolase [Lactarius akahatsu]